MWGIGGGNIPGNQFKTLNQQSAQFSVRMLFILLVGYFELVVHNSRNKQHNVFGECVRERPVKMYKDNIKMEISEMCWEKGW